MDEVTKLLKLEKYKITKIEERSENNKIKVIKRIKFGYRNFKFFRLRIMYILNGKLSGITKND